MAVDLRGRRSRNKLAVFDFRLSLLSLSILQSEIPNGRTLISVPGIRTGDDKYEKSSERGPNSIGQKTGKLNRARVSSTSRTSRSMMKETGSMELIMEET